MTDRPIAPRPPSPPEPDPPPSERRAALKVVLFLIVLGVAARAFTYLERQWRRSNAVALDAAPASDVRVVDEGAQPRVKLDAWFKTGATKRSKVTLTTTTTTGDAARIVPLVAAISNRVIAVTPAEARVEWKLESLEIARSALPDGADVSELQKWIDSVPRTPVVRVFQPGGRVGNAGNAPPDAGADDVTTLRFLGDALVLAAPEIPVGAGARWQVHTPEIAKYELVARANGRTKVRISMSMSMATPQGAVAATTSGEMEYADGDPLPIAGQATFRFAMEDAAATPTVEITMSIASP